MWGSVPPGKGAILWLCNVHCNIALFLSIYHNEWLVFCQMVTCRASQPIWNESVIFLLMNVHHTLATELANDWLCHWMCTVELSDAGDGTIEITITGPNGQLIPHQIITVEPSLLEVHYTPMMTGIHQATVTFNGACVPGCWSLTLLLWNLIFTELSNQLTRDWQT